MSRSSVVAASLSRSSSLDVVHLPPLLVFFPPLVSAPRRYHSTFLKTNFSWTIVALYCCQFLLFSKVNQLYVYLCPLSFGFPSHLGHHRALSGVPCAVHEVLISYLFYRVSVVYTCQSQSPNSFHSPLSMVSIHLFSISVCK